MVSDDTEHAFLTAQALLIAGGDPERFARALAVRLRWWLLALPGGCGMATAKGLIRSWIGFSPARSGVQSACNGPSMRAAIIGVHWAEDPERLKSFMTASTLITHRDERALTAAMAVGIAARHCVRAGSIDDLVKAWRGLSSDPRWITIVDVLDRRLGLAGTVDEVASELGCPDYVTGFAFHSVPVALYAWLRHRGDPTMCIGSVLRCGGDTDTIGAIAGALLGAEGGCSVFPPAWQGRIADWPLSCSRLRAAGSALASGSSVPVGWWWPFLPIRNVVFIIIILMHGFRRLLP
jgi:ADP-ribosylglycohydrolase